MHFFYKNSFLILSKLLVKITRENQGFIEIRLFMKPRLQLSDKNKYSTFIILFSAGMADMLYL
jgi:hypothetical protein